MIWIIIGVLIVIAVGSIVIDAIVDFKGGNDHGDQQEKH